MKGMNFIMAELIRLAVEENHKGTMIHLIDMPGAFTRAEKLKDAITKVTDEVRMYKSWIGKTHNKEYEIEIVQKETTNAQLDDGDTEILTIRDKDLDIAYFQQLKMLALKSAEDFQKLYDSIPDKECNDISKIRTTFYGKVPANAKEMLSHVDKVKAYYLSRINIDFSGDRNDLIANRIQCLKLIESDKNAMSNPIVFIDNEYWTTAKVLRRFIWHDRIHARALYRFAVKKWGYDSICDAFSFNMSLAE
ncbi:hypothetical protein [Clostridium thermosuccinogenes]|nr:hypothetical protein [Pseudoclostridium thermosuccinogenes]